jgi:signal transduction histidine kinase
MKFIFLLTAILQFFCSSAQVLMNRDSLLKILPTIKEDSAGVEFYINLGQQYEGFQPELAKQYYKKAGDISERISYKAGIIRYIFNYTFVLNMQSRYDSGLVLNLRSVEIARELKDSLLLGKALFNTGTSCRLLLKYDQAIQFYDEGRKVFESNNDSLLAARSYDILQLLYYNIDDYDKGIEYGEKSVKLLRTADDSVWLGTALNNLGMTYLKKKMYDKAELVFGEAMKIGERTGNSNVIASQMLNMGELDLQLGKYEKLKTFFSRALELFTQLQSDEGMVIALRGLSIYHFYRKEFIKARDYGLQSLEIANRANLLIEKKKTLETLSHVSFALHDVITGDKYLRTVNALSDTVISERIRKTVLEMESRFETRQKESRIRQLESDTRIKELTISRKNVFNYILIGGLGALLLISLLFFRNYRQKQKLQQKRITELETEKQLAAMEAVLKGEEQERTRLAKDLHDGLGGMLSGIKYSLNTMKGNLIMTPDNAQAFERSMDMLDSSIKEMRRVAHNMMPEALVKFGLDTALKDFCNDINQSGALKVNYQSIGLSDNVIDQTTAITVYRIVQELLNNTMKHAAARNAIVQVSKSNGLLAVEVEDDGKGFDAGILKKVKGIGWDNIQHRVEFLKGKVDVNSQPGKGTSVHFEINL